MIKQGTYFKVFNDIHNRPYACQIKAKFEDISPKMGMIKEVEIIPYPGNDEYLFTEELLNILKSREIGSRKFYSKCFNVIEESNESYE